MSGSTDLDGARLAGSEQPADEAPDALGHEDDDEDDRNAVNREVKARDAFEKTQPFGNEDEQTRADRRADRRGDAAEQRHRQEDDRIGEGELIGADVGKSACKKPTAEPAQQRAEREGGHLGAEDVNAGGAGGEFVVAHRTHRAPETRVGKAPDEIAGDRERGDREREISVARGETGWPSDRADAIRPMGDADRVDEDDGQDLLEGDRHHGQVMTAQAQGREAERGARRESERHAAEQAKPEREMVIDRPEGDAIGAQREERGLGEIDLTAQSQDDRQAEHRDRIGRRLHQNVGDVTVGLDGRRQRDQHDCDERVGDVSDRGATHPGHAFSATRSPKMPCGRTMRKAMSTRKAKASLNGTEI